MGQQEITKMYYQAYFDLTTQSVALLAGDKPLFIKTMPVPMTRPASLDEMLTEPENKEFWLAVNELARKGNSNRS